MLTATLQSHPQSLKAEMRLKAVGELPSEHIPGEDIHDRHSLEETFPLCDVVDVGRPYLVRCGVLLEVHQTGESYRTRGSMMHGDAKAAEEWLCASPPIKLSVVSHHVGQQSSSQGRC
jgi:hypothetical protein